MKRLIALILVASLILGTQIVGVSGKTFKKKGKYETGIMCTKKRGKKLKKYVLKNSVKNKCGYVGRTKLKNNTLTTWGTWLYKNNGKKKYYKYRKYKFKLSPYIEYYEWMPNYNAGYHLERMSNRAGRNILRHSQGSGFTFYVKYGKVYKITLGG